MSADAERTSRAQSLVAALRDRGPFEIADQTLANCVLAPIRGVAPVVTPAGVLSQIGGIFTEDGEFHLPSALVRTDGFCQFAAADDIGAVAERIAAPCVYGGVLFEHYGHFVLESLARAMFFPLFADCDIVFHAAGGGVTDAQRLPAHLRGCFELLGIDPRRLRLVSRATRIDELHVPAPRLRHWDYVDPQHLRHLEALAAAAGDGAATGPRIKLYLSRSRLDVATVGPAILAEDAFEDYLRDEGFTIAHPETLSPRAQIGLFERAEVTVGFIGSAFHTAVFCRGGLSLIYLLQRPGFPAPYRQYRTIDEAKGNRAEYVQAFVAGDDDLAVVDFQKISTRLLLAGVVERTFAQASPAVRRRHRLYTERLGQLAATGRVTKARYLALRKDLAGR